MKIVIDDKIPFIRGVFEPYAEVVYLPGKETTPEAVRDADALITRTRTVCDEKLLRGSAVRLIATATIGYDHIDTVWCQENGIIWKNAPGCNSASVCQWVSSVLVSLCRRHKLRFRDLTLGVVGVGNVGSKVASMAEILGFKVLRCDPPRARCEGGEDFVTLDEIVAESDIVTLHVPLYGTGEDATWHLFDKERIAQMRNTQILINSSRGPVVDGGALKEALKAHRLRAAVLDVWEGEPQLDRELIPLLDITTPHIAGYSADGKANGTAAAVRTVARELGIEALKDWTASGVPAPARQLSFELDAFGKDIETLLSEALIYAYDVEEDSRALRNAPELFEKLRGDYPVRREAPAFTLTLKNGTDEMACALKELGFIK
ncbi:MAG: 4-phosphoerythronate dehydrogenase [Alistipes sp.]|nr:4-phosphoerythronate dehydrogenase [Candidatus Minthomonas equi]